ncbi:cupin domain-containing protein [Klenkia terrae]|uniref:cupin domain-containing protein n=1 Tax=Klenkia terrae TaxID=1052259 RepID=UPI0036083A74
MAHRGRRRAVAVARAGELELQVGPDVVVLGPEHPQALVPAGVRQRAAPVAGEVLVSCVVSPGFEWSGFSLG